MKFVVVSISCNLPVYLFMALACSSLFCWVYLWSLISSFVLFAISTLFQIIRAFNERVQHVRVLVFSDKNLAITLPSCVG